MSENETKTQGKVEAGQETDKGDSEGVKRNWREKVKRLFQSTFTLDRLCDIGLVGLVCVIGIILFLTLKKGGINKNENRS